MNLMRNIFIILFLVACVNASWFNESWQYCRNVTISSGFVANYTHDIILNSSNFDFTQKPDYSDLRFFEGSCFEPNVTMGILPAFNQSLNADNAIIKIRTTTPNISSVAMYYGNPLANGAWNVTNIGILGEDFTDYTGGNTTSLIVTGNVTGSGGIVDLHNNTFAGAGSCAVASSCIATRTTIVNNTMWEFSVKYLNSSITRIGGNGSGFNQVLETDSTTGSTIIQAYDGAGYYTTVNHANDWIIGRFTWANNYWAYYENFTLKASNNSGVPLAPLTLYFGTTSSSSSDSYLDWFVARHINTTTLTYSIGTLYSFNASVIDLVDDNRTYLLNESAVRFNFLVLNVSAPTNYYVIVNNQTIRTATTAVPLTVDFNYSINVSGTYYYYIETDDPSLSNRTPTQRFFINTSVRSYSPDNAVLSSSSVPFVWETWTTNNVTYTIRLNNNILAIGTLNSIGNTTAIYTIPTENVYYWNVTIVDSVMNTTTVTDTKAFSLFTVSTLFEDYLNVNISTCTAQEVGYLSVCNDKARLTKIYNFSAVVCPYLNTTPTYTCITNHSIGVFTKNNYTIFYAPNTTWSYATNLVGVEHIGAVWTYQGNALDGRFELIPPNSFIFIPAQNRTTDCGVKYVSNCSYFGGFTVNNKQVLVSDSQGIFYTTSGIGLTNYTEVDYGTVVLNTPLSPLQYYTVPIFGQGVYTIMSCNNVNNTYTINVINTMERDYSVVVEGTGSLTYTTTAKSLSYSVPIYNDSIITVSSSGNVICGYSYNRPIFLNTSLSFINTDFLIYVLYVFEIFILILSVYSPLFFFFFVIVNDAFSVFGIPEVSILFAFAVIASFIMNISSFERGLKHVMILLALFTGYVMVLSPYQAQLNTDFSPITGLVSAFDNVFASDSLGSLVINSITFIFSFLQTIVTLPAIMINFLFSLMFMVSPGLYPALGKFKDLLVFGISAYVYLKAYEIITKQFRGV